MKAIISIVTILIISIPTFSQFGVKGGLSLAKEVNPKGHLYAGGNVGLTYQITERFRAEILFEGMFIKEKTSLIISTGSPFGNQPSLMLRSIDVIYSFIPMTIGIDYIFLTGKIQPYAGLNLGIVSIGTRLENKNYDGQYFTMHPKVGVNIVLTEKLLLDFVIKHHLIFKEKESNGIISQTLGMNIGVNYVF